MYCGETAGQIETNPIFAPVLRTWIGYTVLTVVRTPPRGLNRVRTQEYGLVPVYKQIPAKFCPTAAKGRIATWGGGFVREIDLLPASVSATLCYRWVGNPTNRVKERELKLGRNCILAHRWHPSTDVL